MKLSISRSELLRALAHTQSVVERRNTVPILANVKLKAVEGALTLTATDMDLEITETVAAQVSAPGATTVPALMLHDIVRKLADDAAVSLSVEGGGTKMVVTSGRSRFNLACLPVGDFPELGAGDLDISFQVPASSLRALIDKTRFAVSADETRYYLQGIYMHAVAKDGINLLRAAATDGHRLARFQMPLPEGAGGMQGIILPKKCVAELRKLLDEAADAIRISLSANKIRVTLDHIVLTSKLIDGTFPDYEKVIPVGNDQLIEVEPKAFKAALDRVAIIASEKTRAIKATIAGKTLTLSAQSPEAGSASEELEIRNDGVQLEVGFNARYLMDIVEQIDGAACRLSMAGAGGPTIVQDAGDESALYVIMPLRV